MFQPAAKARSEFGQTVRSRQGVRLACAKRGCLDTGALGWATEGEAAQRAHSLSRRTASPPGAPGPMAGARGTAERELRSSPAFAEVLHFARTFAGCLKQAPFPAERLEAALLDPAAHDFPRWFFSLAFSLCRGPLSEEERRFVVDPDPDVMWEQTLCERVAAMHQEEPEKSPLSGGRSWFDLTPVERVRKHCPARATPHRCRPVQRVPGAALRSSCRRD